MGCRMQVGQAKNVILDEYLASLHTGLQCYQLYESRSVKNEAVRICWMLEFILAIIFVRINSRKNNTTRLTGITSVIVIVQKINIQQKIRMSILFNWRKSAGLTTVNLIAGQVWLSGNALASINIVALRQTRLVPGWVTICERVNYLGM